MCQEATGNRRISAHCSALGVLVLVLAAFPAARAEAAGGSDEAIPPTTVVCASKAGERQAYVVGGNGPVSHSNLMLWF